MGRAAEPRAAGGPAGGGKAAKRVAAAARGAERRLVDDVGQLRPAQPGRVQGQLLQVDGRGQGALGGVHLEHGEAAARVGQADRDAPVEAARPQKRRVQGIAPSPHPVDATEHAS
jgi:hypothetical protein